VDGYLAVPLALVAAISFGVSGVVEHRCTRTVRARGALEPGLLVDLARRPAWLAAVGASLAGFALQAAALRFGALAVVQPLLVSSLPFAVAFAALASRQKPDRIAIGGAACCAGGLAGFLAIAQPEGGSVAVSLRSVLPLAAVLAAVLALCLAVAHRYPGAARALALALACGVLYGVAAFLLKSVTALLGGGIISVLGSWPLYAAVVIGPVGFLLNQNAFQAGALAAPVLAVITTADPLVSIVIAKFWFGEHFDTTAWRLGAEIALFAVMTAGIAALACRTPQAAGGRRDGGAGQPAPVARRPQRVHAGRPA
jgi:drug/metabolite transporter (DMT)-like permease